MFSLGNYLIDLLIDLTAFQPSWVILCLKVRESCSLYVFIYIFLFCCFMIFNQIYSTHWCDPNWYYHSGFKVNLGVIAMKVYPTLPRSPNMELSHQMQLSFIPRNTLGGVNFYIGLSLVIRASWKLWD